LGKYLIQDAAELLRLGHESAVGAGELRHGRPEFAGQCHRGPVGELPGGGGPGGDHDPRRRRPQRGWTPSLGYKPIDEFPAMRHRIDAAADASGRRRDEIRSILNLSIRIGPDAQPQQDMVTGSARQAVSQLRHLLGLGFTGFNFLVDGPDQIATMQRIAEEVLPALRSTG